MALRSVLHLFSCLSLTAVVIADLKSEYDHAAYLDPEETYKLYWSVKDADKSIHFAVEVKTVGWVGFGISAGLSGNMKSADMVAGWVDSKGKGHLQVNITMSTAVYNCLLRCTTQWGRAL